MPKTNLTSQQKKEVKKEINKEKEKLEEKLKKEEEKLHKKLFSHAINGAGKFKNEFSKSLNTAIVAAFGFLIALAWRDVISEWISAITSVNPVKGKLIEAIIITMLAVIGILLISKLIPKKE
jgi:hypothetical protein